MATKLDEYVPQCVGPKPFYPWDEWFDGSIWRLRRGEDFECLVRSMSVYARERAKDRRFACAVHIHGNDVIIVPEPK